jgi:DeoR/GlpR family transcriptional regulator of sugar metabolism
MSVAAIAAQLGASAMTIRRDLWATPTDTERP